NPQRFWSIQPYRVANFLTVNLQRQERPIGSLAAARPERLQPARDGELAGHLGIDSGKIVKEPVSARADRQAQADIQIAIVVILEAAAAAAVEDIERVQTSRQGVQDILGAEAVVAPNNGSALFFSRFYAMA